MPLDTPDIYDRSIPLNALKRLGTYVLIVFFVTSLFARVARAPLENHRPLHHWIQTPDHQNRLPVLMPFRDPGLYAEFKKELLLRNGKIYKEKWENYFDIRICTIKEFKKEFPNLPGLPFENTRSDGSGDFKVRLYVFYPDGMLLFNSTFSNKLSFHGRQVHNVNQNKDHFPGYFFLRYAKNLAAEYKQFLLSNNVNNKKPLLYWANQAYLSGLKEKSLGYLNLLKTLPLNGDEKKAYGKLLYLLQFME